MNRIVVLISGTGRNLQAILAACQKGELNAEVAAVISNKTTATGLQWAQQAGVPTIVVPHRDFPNREAFEQALAANIDHYEPQTIALAGFMRVLGDRFVNTYLGRMLNIHPSLLPDYPGLQTHRRVLEAGDSRHGASVHFVTPELDGGPVVLQGHTDIQPDDDETRLANRVMQDIEQRILPIALDWHATGRLTLQHNQALLDGNLLHQPLQLAALSESA